MQTKRAGTGPTLVALSVSGLDPAATVRLKTPPFRGGTVTVAHSEESGKIYFGRALRSVWRIQASSPNHSPRAASSPADVYRKLSTRIMWPPGAGSS